MGSPRTPTDCVILTAVVVRTCWADERVSGWRSTGPVTDACPRSTDSWLCGAAPRRIQLARPRASCPVPSWISSSVPSRIFDANMPYTPRLARCPAVTKGRCGWVTNWATIALDNHVSAAGEYWKGLLLYSPDMSCALTRIGGLSALTGLLRMIKTINAGHRVRGCLPAPRCRARPGTGTTGRQRGARPPVAACKPRSYARPWRAER